MTNEELDKAIEPVVQPDMVMVPREPTKAMCIAAVNAIGWPSRIDHVQAKTYYKAMIAAAEGKK